MATERVDISFGARLHELQKEVEKLPGIGAKEAKKLVAAMDKEYKKNERLAAASAKRAAKASRDGWKAAGTAAVAGLGVASAAVIGFGAKVVQLQQHIADTVNELLDMEARTGVTAKTLGGLRLAADGSGQKLQGMSGGLEALTKKLRDAHLNGGAAAKSFDDMGIAYEDGAGNMREADDVLRDGLKLMRDTESATEKAAIMRELFGDAGGKFVQALGNSDLEDHIRLNELLAPSLEANAESAALWQRQMAALSTVVDGATAAVLEHLDISDAVDGAVLLIAMVSKAWEEAVARSSDLLSGYGEVVKAVVTGDFGAWQSAVADLATTVREGGAAVLDHGVEIRRLQERTQKATGETRQLAAAIGDVGDGADDTKGKIKDLAAAIKEQVAAAQSLMGAQDNLRAIVRASTDDMLTDEERIEQAYRDREAAILALTERAGWSAEVREALDAAEARRVRDLRALHLEAADEVTAGWVQSAEDAAEAMGDLEAVGQRIDQAMRQAAREMVADTIEAANAVAGLVGSVAGALAELHADQVSDIRERSNERTEAFKAARADERQRIHDLLERGEIDEKQHSQMLADLKEANKAKREAHFKQRKAEFDAMIRGWKAQKRAQKAQAWIDFGRNVASLIPAFAISGPAAPGLALGTATVAHGMAMRRIDRQEPPAFSGGGAVWERFAGHSSAPDHQVISSRLDEGIVSPRGMTNIGSQGLDAINRGEQIGGDVILRIDGRDVARAPRRSGETLRPLAGRLAGRAPIYGRG